MEQASIVIGAPGSGKSSLLEHIARECEAIVVRLSPREPQWTYPGVSALAAAFDNGRGEAIRAALRAAEASQSSPVELAGKIDAIVRKDPTSRRILVDDLDSLDDHDAIVLAHLMRRLTGTGVHIVATATSLSSDSPFSGLRRIPLENLATAESTELIRRRFPGINRGVARIVANLTGGSPGAISQVRLAPHELDGRAAVSIPLRYSAAPPQAELPDDPTAKAVLNALAIAPISSVRAFAAHDRAWLDALQDLAYANHVDIRAGRATLTNPLVRAQLFAAQTASERRNLHRVLERVHASVDPALARWHASFVDPRTDDDLVLLDIATEFATEGEPIIAIEFAERASILNSAHPQRELAIVRLADALFLRGEFSLCELMLRRMSSTSRTGGLRLRVARLSALISFGRDGRIPGRELNSLVAAVGQDFPDEAVALLRTLARLHIERWEFELAADRLADAARLHTGPVDRQLQLLAVVVRAGIGDAQFDLDLGGPVDVDAIDAAMMQWDASELILLMWVCVLSRRSVDVEAIASALLARPKPIQPLWRENVLFLRVLNALQGDDEGGAQEATKMWRAEALPERDLDGPRHAALAAVMLLVGTQSRTNVMDFADRAVERCTAEHLRVPLACALAIRGRLHLREGRFSDAVDDLRGARDPRVMQRWAGMVRAHADLIESLWARGDTAQARAELAEMKAIVGASSDPRCVAALARAQATCAPDHKARMAFSSARRLAHSAVERRLLEQAAIRRLGASGSSAGVAPLAHLEMLSAEELAIAHLVAEGMRNRDIAVSLFLAQRTVELRLTRIYRKLGITSRARLVALMNAGSS